MRSVGLAEAKLILLGEHFVVYGGLGMACPIPELECKVIVSDSEQEGISVESDFDANFVVRNDEAELRDMLLRVKHVCEALAFNLEIEKAKLHVQIQSNIPIGQGLGSSAALCVALIRAFSAHYSIELGPRYVEYYASLLERHFHPNPSGIDHVTILHGSPIFYSRNSLQLPLFHELTYHFVVASTGARVGKDEAVSAIAERHGSEEFKKLYDESDWLVSRALIALQSNDRRLLGKLMSRSQQLLSRLGVSTPKIDQFVELAREHGALGAKLSGAGCGGVVVSLVREEDSEPLKNIFLDAGADFAFVIKMPATAPSLG
ncbi:MAG: mevalonate kinase [Bradymonadales bacterium]|jgi:mevalonate kinase